MLNGIVKEIKSLNDKFFEMIQDKIDSEDDYVEEFEEARGEISQKLRNKVETFVDFLYRDYPEIYKKLSNEASYAVDEDDEFFIPGFELDEFEVVENYILACLSIDYPYKENVFKKIFEQNLFDLEEDDQVL